MVRVLPKMDPRLRSVAPVERLGEAVLLERGSARVLVTASWLVDEAASIRLVRADGDSTTGRVGRISREHGLAPVVPQSARFFGGLVPLQPMGADVRYDGGSYTRLFYARDAIPPPADTAVVRRAPVLLTKVLGTGEGPEAYFVRVAPAPLPGAAVVDASVHLAAIGWGRSRVSDAGLAVPWIFVVEFLDRHLGWPK